MGSDSAFGEPVYAPAPSPAPTKTEPDGAGDDLISCPACNMVVGRTGSPAPSPASDEARFETQRGGIAWERDRAEKAEAALATVTAERNEFSAILTEHNRQWSERCEIAEAALAEERERNRELLSIREEQCALMGAEMGSVLDALAEERRRREEDAVRLDDALLSFGRTDVDDEAWHGELVRLVSTARLVVASLRTDAPAPQPAPLPEAVRQALAVLTEIADSAAYWSDYDVPLGIVSRVDEAKARLAAALSAALAGQEKP